MLTCMGKLKKKGWMFFTGTGRIISDLKILLMLYRDTEKITIWLPNNKTFLPPVYLAGLMVENSSMTWFISGYPNALFWCTGRVTFCSRASVWMT